MAWLERRCPAPGGDEVLERVDMGNQFTHSSDTRTFRLENRGRRAHQLFWQFLTKEQYEAELAGGKHKRNVRSSKEDDPTDTSSTGVH